MNQPEIGTLKQFWQLKSRSIYIHVPIFKMKLYHPQQQSTNVSHNPYLFFHLPAMKKIVAYTSDLKTLLKTYRFTEDPHAFQIMDLQRTDEHKTPYIIAGSTSGSIFCQPLAPQSNQQTNANQYTLGDGQQKNLEQIYINDILSLGNNKIVNCFNNGTITFWDINQKRKIQTLPKIHSSYTYKLRRVDERLVSCGHDKMTVVTDMIKMRKLTTLQNADSCWCAFPINYNTVASVGLFNRVNIWDVRIKSLVQTAALSNNESSFITAFNSNNLVLGDGNILKKCDLRKMVCNEFTSENLFLSAENIIVTEKGGYVCGRRFEICHFEGVNEVKPENRGVNNIYNPFANGDMFMYSTYFDQVNAQNQQQEEFEDNGQQDDEDEHIPVLIEQLNEYEQQLVGHYQEFEEELEELQSTPMEVQNNSVQISQKNLQDQLVKEAELEEQEKINPAEKSQQSFAGHQDQKQQY